MPLWFDFSLLMLVWFFSIWFPPTSSAISYRWHTQRQLDKKRLVFKRAEKYVKEYRSQEKDLVRLKRQARKVGNFYVEPEPKLALVMRIRG